MSNQHDISAAVYTGERALFGAHDLTIRDTIFADGESPLKHSRDLTIVGGMFKWKYPLWYSRNIRVEKSTWFEMARAGVWYTDHIAVSDSAIEAPKIFRRCHDVELCQVSLPNAAETLWHCDGVRMEHVTAKGDYFAMNSRNMTVDNLTLYGNYSFDGVENVTIKNSKLLSKDAFWNSNHVTVYDSFISGEYLGWNAQNLTLINCTIESLQGLCYVDHLVMKHCRLLNTTLAFEYSTLDATIDSRIQSVLNPTAGHITAEAIDHLIIEPDKVDPSKTTIVCTADQAGE